MTLLLLFLMYCKLLFFLFYFYHFGFPTLWSKAVLLLFILLDIMTSIYFDLFLLTLNSAGWETMETNTKRKFCSQLKMTV